MKMRTKNLLSLPVLFAGLSLLQAPVSAQNLFQADYNGGVIYLYNAANGTKSTFASGLSEPIQVAFDSSGSVYELDQGSGNIYKFSPAGMRSTFASGLSTPTGLAINSAGYVFAADLSGNVYEYTPAGVRSTFASGLECSTCINRYRLAFDSSGNLFVAEIAVGTIYEFTPGGQQSTFASGLSNPFSLAVDGSGDVFVGDVGTEQIYEFTPGGVQSTFASGVTPQALAFDMAGDLFVKDGSTASILEYTSAGVKSTFASSLSGSLGAGLGFQPMAATPMNENLFIADSSHGTIDIYNKTTGTKSTFASGLNTPIGFTFDSEGDVFVGDYYTGNIYKLTPAGVQSTFASGVVPDNLAVDSANNLYVADSDPAGDGSGNIYEYTPTGVRSTFFSGLSAPSGMAFDNAGNLYVADGHRNINEITPGGTQSVFATIPGNGWPNGFRLAFDSVGNLFVADIPGGTVYKFGPGGGTPSIFASGLRSASGLAIDSADNVFVEDNQATTMYEFTPAGVQTTFASGASGSEMAFQPIIVHGPALTGNLFIAFPCGICATENGWIYKLSPNGTLTTFASGFTWPTSLAFDGAGNLFVLDTGNNNSIFEFKNINGTLSSTPILFASGLAYPAFQGLVANGTGDVFEPNTISGDIYEFSPSGQQSIFYSMQRELDLGMTIDGSGNLYVPSDYTYKITPGGMKSVFGPNPFGTTAMACDSQGDIFEIEGDGDYNRIYKYTQSGVQTTIDNGLYSPIGATCDDAGNLFVSDYELKIPNLNTTGIYKYTPNGGRSVLYMWSAVPPDQALAYPEGLAFQPR